MAKFGSYFGLCPLIDHRSLLGISEDAENDKVLVTLGGHIAMQYELSNQKQILSWTTKEKFTSPVIFDSHINKYVAVFNQMAIRCWNYSNPQPDKVKPLKFKTDIDTLISVQNISYIIFKDGNIVALQNALHSFKTLEPEKILKEKEYIKNIISCAVKNYKYIGLLVENSETGTSYLTVTIFNELEEKYKSIKITLKRECCELVGCAFHLSEQEIQLLTLWSDGKLCLKILDSNLDEPFEVFSIIESISCVHPVSIVSLDKDYIAMYGSNSNQEGALLVIYNMQFKVTQCRQPFKLVTLGAKLWPIQNKVILPVGQNLAVVPYHLEKEQLSALIGSHRVNRLKSNEEDIAFIPNLEVVTWSTHPPDVINGDSYWRKIAKDYLDQGYSESAILQDLIPIYIENKNLEELSLLLKHSDDIPDKCLAELLQYILQVPDQYFKNCKQHPQDSYPQNLQPYKRYKLLKLILQKPINEIYLISYLRVKLNFESALKLLNFILFLLGQNIEDTDFINKLIDWICLILDANYQIFLLTKDGDVEKILLSLSEFVSNELISLEYLQEIVCLVNQVTKKKKITKILEHSYSVEKIVL